MKILPLQNYNSNYSVNNKATSVHTQSVHKIKQPVNTINVSFKGFNPLKPLSDYLQYKRAQIFSDKLNEYVKKEIGEDNFSLRFVNNIENLEGIQYNIPPFKGLTIKEIQYMSEYLHVIAVKRGCTHMCGHCYAEAKPSNREMSYEDFHSITDGFKTLRKRLHNLDIFGKNLELGKYDPIYRTTEMFFDADCMDIAIKDKQGKIYDFVDLSKELHDALGRTTVFDTCGWSKSNTKLQAKAEEYAKHFSNPENMKKLEAFNVSFNVFNATYIASVKALQAGDKEKAARLRNKFTDNMANVLFTFTPVSNNKKFEVMCRAFNPKVKNAKYFTAKEMAKLIQEVLIKLEKAYEDDFSGEQKVIKCKGDIKGYLMIMKNKMAAVNTALNSSGRMKEFMKEHNIDPKNLQNVDEITKLAKEIYKDNPRTEKAVMHKLIDTDGKLYNMNYATMFKTDIQLNIDGKSKPTPKLASVVDDFVITKKNINK